MPDISEYVLLGARFLLPLMAVWLLLRCVRSMLREQYEPETWAWLVCSDGARLPVNHWECIIGRSGSSDVRLAGKDVERTHAELERDAQGVWTITDLRTDSGTYVNGEEAGDHTPVYDGDVIEIGGNALTFHVVSRDELKTLERRRSAPGFFVGPGVSLLILTLFQALLALEFTVTAESEHLRGIVMAFAALAVTEWFCYFLMRSIRRSGFEPETLAFFLTTLGFSVCATSTPDEMFKETLLMLFGVALFFLLGWWLRELKRVKAVRLLAALASLGLLALNLVAGSTVFGAKNWLIIAGVSVQPSELVKVVYIYTGAATLDRLFARRNLFGFIAFSAACVLALALMGDFGTAVVFFAAFLVIAFMRSGSFATVFLAIGGAVMAATLVLSVKPYIAERFASWGHVWEDVWDKGYQQTRAMSAAASGGLFGKGAGNGWLTNIGAADTDMVFAVLSEELGLIIAVCAVLSLVALALFAVRNASQGRSTFYVIAGCSAASMMLVQTALNVFGSLDLLPFTGVTFPFVSKGGTSLISCWMLLAYIKATDTRRNSSFVVRSARSVARKSKDAPPEDDDGDDEEYEPVGEDEE